MSGEQKKVLPSALECEEAALAFVLSGAIGSDALVGALSPFDFVDQKNRLTFQAIAALAKRGTAVDCVSLADEERSERTFEDAGGNEKLMDVVQSLVSGDPNNFDYYVRRVKEASRARRFILKCRDVAYSFDSMKTGSWGDFVDGAKADLDEICLDGDIGSLQSAKEVADETVQEIKDYKEASSHGGLTGIETGLGGLNRKIHGWQKGHLIVIAGKTSMGKSAFAAHTSWSAAKAGCSAAYYSLEMTNRENMRRIIANVTRIDAERFDGYLTPAEMASVDSAAQRIGKADFAFCDRLSGYEEITASIVKWKARNPALSLVVIDYLQLMWTNAKGVSRDREIGLMTGGLKRLANKLDIALILLSQVNRGSQSDMPTMDNLRESGNIEQDANEIILIHRPDYFDPLKPQTRFSKTLLIVAKHRGGQTGTVEACYDKASSNFIDWQDDPNQKKA